MKTRKKSDYQRVREFGERVAICPTRREVKELLERFDRLWRVKRV